jgi:uncharacterized protein (TIGR02001 family)
MKKLVHALVLTGLMGAPALVMAEDSPHSLSANVSMTSNYVFRGISQTGGDAAIQGGLDYSHSSGFYLGTWGSNVGWIEDFQGYGSGNMEVDVYGGYRGGFGDDISYDLGAIQYMYPGDKYNNITTTTAVTGDTTELYASVGWKWFTAKYSYYVSDEVFGFANADGSDYIDISASVPIGETGLTAGAHWGTFSFDNNSAQDYDDWKVSLAYDMGKLTKVADGVTVGVMYTDTNAKRTAWTDANNQFLGKSATTVWVSKSF